MIRRLHGPWLPCGVLVLTGCFLASQGIVRGADEKPARKASKEGTASKEGKAAKKGLAKKGVAKKAIGGVDQDPQSYVNYFFQQFDQSGDGKITREEAPERVRENFDRIDGNSDGSLTKEELLVATRAMFRRQAQLGANRPPEPKLPGNLEAIKPKVVEGRVNLPLIGTTGFGKPLTSVQLDELIAEELSSEGLEKAKGRISDDRFIRRAYLDVIGRLPSPRDIEQYVADQSPGKKAKLIDYLLSLPQYGENWARYWRDVISFRSTAAENRSAPFDFEPWLAARLNENANWASIVTEILTAKGLSTEKPQGFFIGVHEGKAEELAGETSRVFLGIQISCAQCHDHPTDSWKRDQFHELASFFGRSAIQLRRDLGVGPRGPVVEIRERPFRAGEYRKPDLKDPSKPGEMVVPVFLTGQPLPDNTSDDQRRKALATFITSKHNPYFAKAYVNRVWAELMGYGFTNPVDDLGPERPVVYPALFDTLAQSFAASDYDTKGLLRTILNSHVYDRRFETLENGYDNEVLFTAIMPTRLSADQIFDSLDWVLGNIDDGQTGNIRRPAGRRQFQSIFGFDPSADPAEIEGSIPQALAIMNSPQLHQRMSAAQQGTLLNKLLRANQDDSQVVHMLYLRVLARKPSRDEIDICLASLKEAKSRNEGFEDILWALLNSTEFLNNH